MVDIFILYAGEEREKAELLANALASEGWSVYWDPTLYRGHARGELDEALCVLLLLSAATEMSKWVIEEAMEAQKNKKLIGVRVGDLPQSALFMDLLETLNETEADLASWDGSEDDDRYKALLADLKALVGNGSRPSDIEVPDAAAGPDGGYGTGDSEEMPGGGGPDGGYGTGDSEEMPGGGGPDDDIEPEILLGAAAPDEVRQNEEFVAYFAAYTEDNSEDVERLICVESTRSHLRRDLARVQWESGTEVTVRLSVPGCEVENSVQPFIWEGGYNVLRFDVSVPESVGRRWLTLRFDLSVSGMTLIRLRPEVQVIEDIVKREARVLATERAPKTAFASYASRDRHEVLSRIRSVVIATGMDVFTDCLSIVPGEGWRERLKDEIADREVFWLFWSRKAMASPAVAWEWRTALGIHGLPSIQPHPLQDTDVAPPPPELEELQFGNAFETYANTRTIVGALRILIWRTWSSIADLKVEVQKLVKPESVEPEPVEPPLDPTDDNLVYLIYDGRDLDGIGELDDYLYDQGLLVIHPYFGADVKTAREDHEDALRTCDAVVLYHGEADALWLRAKLREISKIAGQGRTKEFLAKLVYVGGPKTDEKERYRTTEAMVVKAFDAFNPDELAPFVAEILRRDRLQRRRKRVQLRHPTSGTP